jgi:hypothetical protein
VLRCITGAGTQKEVDIVIRHVDKLKQMPPFRAAHVMIILESNNCWARSMDFYHAVKAYPRTKGALPAQFRFLCITHRETPLGADQPIGIWLGRDNLHKLRMAMHFKHALIDKRVRFFKDFVAETPNIQKMIRDQFGSIEIIDANKKVGWSVNVGVPRP